MPNIFINEYGRARSGWRVLLFILALIAITVLLVSVGRIAFVIVGAVVGRIPHAGFVAEVIYRVGMLAAALIAGYLCARFFEGLPWRSLGLTLHSGWLRDLIVGLVVGFVSLAIAVGVTLPTRGLLFGFNNLGLMSVAGSMIGSGALFFVAALAEEAIFRGYGLQTLTRAKLAWLAVVLTSVPFGLVHLRNPNVVPGITFINTVLAGLWFAVAYLRTRSLWLPLGLHWSWNWALGWFFGLPVSGAHVVSTPLLKALDVGPFWLTGGSYGIEGGLACTVALGLSTLFLWRTPWLSATPELKKLTSEENPATASPVLSIRSAEDHA